MIQANYEQTQMPPEPTEPVPEQAHLFDPNCVDAGFDMGWPVSAVPALQRWAERQEELQHDYDFYIAKFLYSVNEDPRGGMPRVKQYLDRFKRAQGMYVPTRPVAPRQEPRPLRSAQLLETYSHEPEADEATLDDLGFVQPELLKDAQPEELRTQELESHVMSFMFPGQEAGFYEYVRNLVLNYSDTSNATFYTLLRGYLLPGEPRDRTVFETEVLPAINGYRHHVMQQYIAEHEGWLLDHPTFVNSRHVNKDDGWLLDQPAA